MEMAIYALSSLSSLRQFAFDFKPFKPYQIEIKTILFKDGKGFTLLKCNYLNSEQIKTQMEIEMFLLKAKLIYPFQISVGLKFVTLR